MKAVAIVSARNEALHIGAALAGLIAEGLDVVLIDHDSDDGTRELARPFLGRGLLGIERTPWRGTFSLKQQLEAKSRVAEALDHDWIVHADCDEWLRAPVADQTLLEALRVADEAGYNTANFNEFVFLPRRGETLEVPHYRSLATRYYYFRPYYPSLQRAWKHRVGLDNRSFAGHVLTGPVRQYPVDFTLRHYLALSESFAARKYGSRLYAPDELAAGWHFDRVGLSPDSLRFPADDGPEMQWLPHWTSTAFNTSQPVREHFWCWERAPNAACPE